MLENIKNNLPNLTSLLINKQVVVVYGGFCSEREVSLISGNEVYKALKESNIDVIKYEVTNDIIELWNFLISIKGQCVVFNALHGSFGEDGSLAAILDSLKIPYTHSGLTTSALAMNKFLTKKVASSCDILIAKGILVSTEVNIKIENLLYPLIMKPNNEGSSIDVFLLKNKEDLVTALNKCKNKYKEVLIEEYLPGEEYSVGLIKGKALEVTNIIPQGNNVFYNYESKYSKNGSNHIIPAKVNKSLRNYMLTCAERLYKTIGCKGVARVDFKEKDGKVYFLEINTQPGFTATSLLPEQAKYCQITFNELCLILLSEALNN